MAAYTTSSTRSSPSSSQFFIKGSIPEADQGGFKILFENLRQLMSFKVGEKPLIDKKLNKITVDKSLNAFGRWWYQAFNADFIDTLCQKTLRTLSSGDASIQKGMKGENLTLHEAWALHKAFKIADLLIPSTKTDGDSSFSLALGIGNLAKTYESKAHVYEKLNAALMNWDPRLQQKAAEIIKNRGRLESLIKTWEEAVQETTTASTGRAPVRSSQRQSKRISRRQVRKQGHVDIRNFGFEDLIVKMIKDPKKREVRKAPVSFKELLRIKLITFKKSGVDIAEGGSCKE